MITLRMLGLASAILILLPIGVSALPDGVTTSEDDGESVIEGSQEVAAEVYDVVLARMPREKEYDHETFREEEQLVEGHTVFVVIDVGSRFNDSNGSVDIMGMVECKAEVSYSGPTFLGIPLPERVDRAHVRCRADEHVIVTPDPFQNPPLARPVPTDRLIPFRGPTGELAYAQEYSYPALRQDPDGTQEEATFYAWSVPIWSEPWLDTHGRPKNFYSPIPEDRLVEMGVEDFKVYHQKDAPHFR